MCSTTKSITSVVDLLENILLATCTLYGTVACPQRFRHWSAINLDSTTLPLNVIAQAEAQPGGRYSVVTEFMLRLLVRITRKFWQCPTCHPVACGCTGYTICQTPDAWMLTKLMICRASTMLRTTRSAT